MTIREMTTKWGFEIEHDKLDKVEEQLEKIRGRLEFLAAAEIVKGIFELTEKFAHFGESLQIAAESAGITVEAFQKLSLAASHSSISQEEMGMSLARLGRHLYEARKGSEQSLEAFSEVGISPNQVLSFHTSADAMSALADRFKAIDDPIKKQALAMSLFGRGSTNMVAFLSQGSDSMKELGDEAQKLGAILGHTNVEALAKVEHALSTMWAVLKGVSANIASQFAPSIETAVEQILHFWAANRKLIETNIRAWVWDITYAMGAIWAVIKVVTQAFFDFASAYPVLTRRIFEFLIAFGMFAGALFVGQKIIGVFKTGLEILGMAFKPIGFAAEVGFKPLIWLAGLAQKGIVALLFKLGVLVETAFPALSAALVSFSGFLEATPIGWFIAAIAALIVVVHDAWTLLTGGKWEDTWIYKAYNAIKGFGSKALSFLGLGGGEEEKTTAGATTPSNRGFMSGAANMVENLKEVKNIATTDIGKMLPSFNFGFGGPTPTSNENNAQINAPITINVPAGTDPNMVGQKVKDGIKEHMDRLHRETSRSLQPAQAY